MPGFVKYTSGALPALMRASSGCENVAPGGRYSAFTLMFGYATLKFLMTVSRASCVPVWLTNENSPDSDDGLGPALPAAADAVTATSDTTAAMSAMARQRPRFALSMWRTSFEAAASAARLGAGRRFPVQSCACKADVGMNRATMPRLSFQVKALSSKEIKSFTGFAVSGPCGIVTPGCFC